jgi:prevent-host-death family protein
MVMTKIMKKGTRLLAKETSPAYGSDAPDANFSREVSAGDFKARCLALMDEVRVLGGEYVITKRGTPVAKLVPIRIERRPFRGSMKGTVKVIGDIISPLDEPWEALEGWNDRDDGP